MLADWHQDPTMALDPRNDPNNKPTVPDGWSAIFDDKYNTWYYVDLNTRKSQWEAPQGSTFNKVESGSGNPPPYSSAAAGSDSRGNQYSNQTSQTFSGQPQQTYGSASQGNNGYYQQQGYQQGYAQQQGYATYPQQVPQQQYGYGQQPYGQNYQQNQKKNKFSGAGGMAMGAGAGLLGGLLLSDALHDSHGFGGPGPGPGPGFDDPGFGGGDFGGGDFGGGDFGGF